MNSLWLVKCLIIDVENEFIAFNILANGIRAGFLYLWLSNNFGLYVFF